jgi:hypothetical protein
MQKEVLKNNDFKEKSASLKKSNRYALGEIKIIVKFGFSSI